MIIQKQNGKAVPVKHTAKEKFRMVAKTMMGLEEILADELRAMGAENIECINRAVLFEGDMRLLYRANYTCRTALAILKPFAEFEANNEQELYDQVYRIRWEKILDVDCTFMIDSTTSGDIFTHSYYAALKTKDAIYQICDFCGFFPTACSRPDRKILKSFQTVRQSSQI